jgi:hypothetical protein
MPLHTHIPTVELALHWHQAKLVGLDRALLIPPDYRGSLSAFRLLLALDSAISPNPHQQV